MPETPAGISFSRREGEKDVTAVTFAPINELKQAPESEAEKWKVLEGEKEREKSIMRIPCLMPAVIN